MFNVSAGALAIWLAANLYGLVGPQPVDGKYAVENLLFPVALLSILYFAINSLLIATAVGFERGSSPLELWRRNFLWS